MTAKLSIPWWLFAQGALWTVFVVNFLTVRHYELGMSLGVAAFLLTWVSHDLRGRRR